jgi:Holliday junction resolvase RusA-like endonuclease
MFIPGDAKPGGSKKGFPIRRANGTIGVAIADSSGAPGKAWRSTVKDAAIQHASAAGWSKVLKPKPVFVTMAFLKPRTGGHYGTGRNAGKLKPAFENVRFDTVRPDALKLARSVEDALTDAGIWEDDSQVQFEHGPMKVFVPREAQAGVIVQVFTEPGRRTEDRLSEWAIVGCQWSISGVS